ncbi:dUTP diphosphatase [Helicobacter sp. 16-1353]|uniref:dUTP diphosphatase n=1 Tax=Helicobacter sp. 16-1353 TaxID=2004996 RepID=UPI001C65C8EE|nr:dUTP diphosphatase [Helicobacter sp. 16-1353]
MINLKIKKLNNDAILPKYQSSGASGFDLHSVEDLDILPSEFIAVKTGLSFEIPSGYEIQVRPRSGLAFKNGISVLNTPGTIDSDYRGEVMVILFNFSKNIFNIKKGDRIAQAILSQVFQANLILSDSLDTTERGNSGFGSTGI